MNTTKRKRFHRHRFIEGRSYNYRIRRCAICGYLEALGPGGWSKVP